MADKRRKLTYKPGSLPDNKNTTEEIEDGNHDNQQQRVLHCILHADGTGQMSDQVLPFDSTTWQKVQSIAECRLEEVHQSKYADICRQLLKTPETASNRVGYHRVCFRNFTALKSGKATETESSTHTETQKPLLRSDTGSHVSSSTTGVLKKTCIFCKKENKFVRGRPTEKLGICETNDAGQKLKDAIVALNDQHLLAIVGDVDIFAKEVRYHHSCRRAYISKADRSRDHGNKTKSDYQEARDIHQNAFQKLVDYVQSSVIEEKCAEMLTSLHSRYLQHMHDDGLDTMTYSTQALANKLLRHFGDKICMDKLNNRQGSFVYSNAIGKEEAIRCAFAHLNTPETLVEGAAQYLRDTILKLLHSRPELPYPLTPDSLGKGQAEPPEILKRFLRTVYSGRGNPSEHEHIERSVQSTADDILFTTTRGQVKPAKHLFMGLAMKSLTGSRKIIEILNRFGHSISYHVVEELETDLASTISERHLVTPDGILTSPGLSTATAWDNYDENSETLSGANTLHDTVGICYQNVCDTFDASANHTGTRDDSATQMRRSRQKRTYDVPETAIEPYRKKPKISSFQFDITSIPRPLCVTDAERLDMLWMISLSLTQSNPMWGGWNSQLIKDTLPTQRIAYMNNIQLPPTRLDVVAETLRISQQVAKECGDLYAVVTYDLAIAKPAMQIQQTDSPAYDNVFICFGPFHVMLAFFGSLGYILDGSGGPHILVEAEVLAPGSLNGFLHGKHFNRCKRLHPLLCAAMRILHFRYFLSKTELMTESLETKMAALHGNNAQEGVLNLQSDTEYQSLIEAYEAFSEQTRNGDHGPTAKFWIGYIDLVEIFLLFNRACHTNDLELFIFALGEMVPIFFATSRPNYARYMTKYHLNLLNMDKTHPGVRHILEQGALSIRRTSKSFSRTPVDQTLEQTVNNDAASRLTGISAFTQSITARKRWMITRTVRSSIVGQLMAQAGLSHREDCSHELKPSRVQKDNKDLQKIIHGIENTMIPFGDDTQDGNLYCLATGKVASKDVQIDLETMREKGTEWFNDFRNGCFADENRFEKSIPRRKIKNFASQSVSSKIQGTKEMKVQELKCTRDLFGRLLVLATSNNIDLHKVFAYPLTPVPLSLTHMDGTMNKTDKSALMKKLEGLVESEKPDHIDCYIVDGVFFLHTFPSSTLPSTYGGVAEMILTKLCKLAKTVHLVFDTYKEPSIKAYERDSRAGHVECLDIKITGAEQKRPKDFQKALRSSRFKVALMNFLICEWKRSEYASILGDCQLFVGLDETCVSFKTSDGQVHHETAPELFCQHEEADTRIIWHLMYISRSSRDTCVAIRCTDTDILVLLLHHVQNIENRVMMDVGLVTNNTRRYIDVSSLGKHLGSTLCCALLALHALSGCDYTSAFIHKGKLRPLALLQKSGEYQEAFKKLGNADKVEQDVVNQLEAFVCALYGKHNLSDVNEARLAIFQQSYAPKSNTGPLDKLRGVNPSLLPPCKATLAQKIKRTNYVVALWKSACTSTGKPPFGPVGHGWTLDGSRYKVLWYEGRYIPAEVEQNLDSIENDEDDDLIQTSRDSDSDDSDSE